MKRVLLIWLVCISAATLTARAQSGWTDNMDQALETAKAQNRFMLLNFTGSDWCGWCIKLDKEVFSKNDFKKYAQEKLVLVTVDFPMKKKPSSKVQKQNNELKSKYSIGGYPTIIILDPNGEKIGQTGYKAGGAESYVSHLEEIIAPHAGKFGKTASGPVTSAPSTPAAPALDVRAMRTWTSSKGSEIEARYEQRIGEMVELRRTDGSMVRIDIASLSENDQEFLRSIKAIK